MNRLLYLFILLPFLSCAQTIHTAGTDTVCAGTSVHFTATTTGVASPHYRWQVNGVNRGTDSSGLIIDSVANGDSVRCLLTDSLGAVLGTSNKIVMTVQHMPSAGVIVGPFEVCQGSSIILTDSIPDGLWVASNASATVVGGLVTGIEGSGGEDGSAMDTVFYIITNSCGTDSTATIIGVDVFPDASFFWGYNLLTLCVGGEMWINGGDGVNSILYSKQGDLGFIGNYTVVALHTGMDTVVSIASNACGSDTFLAPTEVIGLVQLMPILAPSNELCVSDSIQLSDLGQHDFGWSASNNNAAVTKSGIVVGLTPGSDTVTLTTGNQCGSSEMNTIALSIIPPGSISGPDSVCRGSEISLNSSGSAGIWNTSDSTVASVSANGTLAGLQQGIVMVTHTIGSCSVSKKIKVNALGSEIVGINELCAQLTTMLSDSIAGGFWSSSNTSIASVEPFSGLVTAVSAGVALNNLCCPLQVL